MDESTLIAASDALQEEFLSQQKGFIKRYLVRTADSKWVDVAYWDSIENAEQAMQNASNSPVDLRYFELMVHADHNDPSTEVMFLNVVRSYL